MKSPISDSLLRLTQEVWGKYYRDPVGVEDARQIVTNIVGLFDLLQEWDCASQTAALGHRQEGASHSSVKSEFDSRPKVKPDPRRRTSGEKLSGRKIGRPKKSRRMIKSASRLVVQDQRR